MSLHPYATAWCAAQKSRETFSAGQTAMKAGCGQVAVNAKPPKRPGRQARRLPIKRVIAWVRRSLLWVTALRLGSF